MHQQAGVASIFDAGGGGIPRRWSAVERGVHRPVSVERVLWFVDRQIEAAIRHGIAAVAEDALADDRAALAVVLRLLPAQICSATITRVVRRGWRTVVEMRCRASDGSFSVISVWDLGPGDRPWVIGFRAVDSRTSAECPGPDGIASPSEPTLTPAFRRRRPLLGQSARNALPGPGRPPGRIEYGTR
jgi:hypothetical protein